MTKKQYEFVQLGSNIQVEDRHEVFHEITNVVRKSTSPTLFTWVDKLSHLKGFIEVERYSSLEDFISHVARKKDSFTATA